MTTIWTPELRAFRDDVRAFCEENLPADIRLKVLAGVPLIRPDHMRWQDILAAKGWLVGFWPRAYGGCDWSAAETYVFQEETTSSGAPWLLPFGVNYVGPVIYTYGSTEQKAEHLPGITSNQVFWCQGYSEPNAGSDLAGLKTRAVRDGEYYIVNGTKIWTTMAHWADWIFCLVRTDPAAVPQRGISFLLIDLRTPGVTIQPIKSIEGDSHLNQVFFEDVRVPARNLVGEENKGWTYAKFLLGHERVLSAEVGKARRYLRRIKRLAARNGKNNSPRLKDRLSRFDVDLLALEQTTLRVLGAILAGEARGHEASVLKIRGSAILQQISDFAVDVLGTAALSYDPEWLRENAGMPLEEIESMGVVSEALYTRAPTIWGGSNEIQRNILAKHALGL
jgi:alkylation response protein AidB-like acyl-CoA dehydrogenase